MSTTQPSVPPGAHLARIEPPRFRSEAREDDRKDAEQRGEDEQPVGPPDPSVIGIVADRHLPAVTVGRLYMGGHCSAALHIG
jgi:hypothetical protein